MPVIRWEEPPPPHWGKWNEVVADLKGRPGEWALVIENAQRNYAASAAQKSLRRKGCRVRTRERDGVMSVWAMWPGDA